MKHRELTDHIRGSFLKRQYLEAFLVQSAYIESLLKLFADFTFFGAAKINTEHHKILDAARGNIERMGLNELINFLHTANLVTKEQKSLLHIYRLRRNKMLHDLITEIKESGFDAELKAICEKGNEIIEHKDFIKMADLIDYLEKPSENKVLEPSTSTVVGDVTK